MPKAAPGQFDFSGGEFSPLLRGRVDADRYRTALKVCENYLPSIQGGLPRRTGTYHVSETRNSSRVRLQRFEFSTVTAYALEFGDEYVRFFTDEGQVLEAAKNITAMTAASPCVVTSAAHGFSNGDEVFISGVVGMMSGSFSAVNGKNFRVANVTTDTFELKDLANRDLDTTGMTYTSGGTVARVYEIVSPYTAAQVPNLYMFQSADVLYVLHPEVTPQQLIRSGPVSWAFAGIDFLDGPYLPENTTSTTLTPSDVTGLVIVTASSTVGINGGIGFTQQDIGRRLRLGLGGVWSWGNIVAQNSPTEIGFQIRSLDAVASPQTAWRLGLWSEQTGFPAAGCFHEDRLVLAGGNTVTPQRVDGSRTGDYSNFSPTERDGTVTATHAFAYVLNSADVNSVVWVESDEKGLLAGTRAGEWTIESADGESALTPIGAVRARQVTGYGSKIGVQPGRAGKAVMFATRTGRKLREMTFTEAEDGFRCPDRTLLADHITGEAGLTQIAYQKEPSRVWCVREDGQLASMTFERDDQSIVVGWARHLIGGTDNPFLGPRAAVVESCCVIPSADGTRELVWLAVKRQFKIGDNVVTKRYIEYITREFDDYVPQENGFFVDSGLTYDNPISITGVTLASEGVFTTASAHGLSAGDRVKLSDIVGLLQGPFGVGQVPTDILNGKYWYVKSAPTGTTFTLHSQDWSPGDNPFGAPLDTSLLQPYESGGQIRKLVRTLNLADHLEGSYVQVVVDGAVTLPQLVGQGGVILVDGDLDGARGAVIHVGLNYVSKGQQLRQDSGSANGTSVGKTRRTHRVGFLFHRSMGLKFGVNTFEGMYDIIFRTTEIPLNQQTPLFSGVMSENLDADYDFNNEVTWMQDRPLPSTILGVMPQLDTQDRL